jgi:endonuclease/exonuclease/phosphatase family metal-dependent hydrolase
VSGLLDDLTSGRLTGLAPEQWVLLLQEMVEPLVLPGAETFAVPVYEVDHQLRSVGIVSTLPLIESRAIALPRERQPRMAAAAGVVVDGVRLFIVSTHFENRVSWLRGGVFGDRARTRQAEALLRALPEGPGILGGDLNTLLGAEPALRLLAERFPDTAPQEEATFRDRLLLDHLFFDLPDGWRADVRVIASRYGSDHHPVLGLVGR